MILYYQQITSLATQTGAKKGVSPLSGVRNIEDLGPQLPPGGACPEDALLLQRGLVGRGHVCAHLGPCVQNSYGSRPLIFSGLGR
jgi:hypothetical protein